MRSIEARITAAENNKHTWKVPHCLHFLLNFKHGDYVLEISRYDNFGIWSAVGDIKSKHLIGREVKHFRSLQKTADYIDQYYKDYGKTYGVLCTAQVLGISFSPNRKEIEILQGMDKHLLLIGEEREIKEP